MRVLWEQKDIVVDCKDFRNGILSLLEKILLVQGGPLKIRIWLDYKKIKHLHK